MPLARQHAIFRIFFEMPPIFKDAAMTMLHSPRAIEIEAQLAPYIDLSQMGGPQLDQLAATANRHARHFTMFSMASFFVASCAMLLDRPIVGASALLPAFVMFLLAGFWASSAREASRVDGDADAEKAAAFIGESSYARKWKDDAVRAERFLRGFDMSAMSMLAEIEKLESNLAAINTAT